MPNTETPARIALDLTPGDTFTYRGVTYVADSSARPYTQTGVEMVRVFVEGKDFPVTLRSATEV